MAHQCDGCGKQFNSLSALRLHDCPHPSDDEEWTVLNDRSFSGESSHREVAEQLLPQLREEMPEEAYQADFRADLQSAVIQSITEDLSANLEYDDWHAMGFEQPTDFLDAGRVSSAIGNQAQWYFEDDQTGKSNRVLQVIFEYAEKYGLAERQSE